MPNNNDLDVDGLVPERRNSSALAMELRLSCTNTSIYIFYQIRWLPSYCLRRRRPLDPGTHESKQYSYVIISLVKLLVRHLEAVIFQDLPQFVSLNVTVTVVIIQSEALQDFFKVLRDLKMSPTAIAVKSRERHCVSDLKQLDCLLNSLFELIKKNQSSESTVLCSAVIVAMSYATLNRWFSARLQYLQCVSNGDTAILH